MDVALRRVSPSDHGTFRAWFRDPCLARWHGNPGPQEADAEFQRIVRSRYNFVIVANGDDVGHVAVEGEWDKGTSAELGIVIHPRHRRHGIGTKALILVVEFAFRETSANRLWAGVVGSNAAALRVCERVGLVEESRDRDAASENGRRVDHVYFAVVADEWRRMKSANRKSANRES